MKDFDYLEKLLHWASSGALSASLAFIVFVPTLSNVNTDYQFFSIASFVLAIPFLAISLARYKEYEIKKSNNEEERSGAHVSSAVIGFLSMVVGFAMLLAAIKLIYLLIFFAALIFMILLEAWADRSKNKS